MTPDTKIRIASISKVAVGMCALAMAEEGLVDLDAPLSAYWGEGAVNPYSQTQPTCRDLMTHTSSLKDLSTVNGLSTLRNRMYSGSSWRSMEPGNGGYWYYSNFGFCILGTTLELASDGLLDYLCVSPRARNGGLGAAILRELARAEADAVIFGESEDPDDAPDKYERYVRIPYDPSRGPGERVDWQQ